MRSKPLALAFVSILAVQTAFAGDCKCRTPRATTPVYGLRAFKHDVIGRVIGATPKEPGGRECADAAERVRRFYEQQGYARAAVDVQPTESGECALRVVEGKRFVLGRIEIGRPDLVELPALLERAELELGGPYSPTAVDRLVEALNRNRRIEPVLREDVTVTFVDEKGTVLLGIRVRERGAASGGEIGLGIGGGEDRSRSIRPVLAPTTPRR